MKHKHKGVRDVFQLFTGHNSFDYEDELSIPVVYEKPIDTKNTMVAQGRKDIVRTENCEMERNRFYRI